MIFKNGLIALPGGKILQQADIKITDGKIAAIEKNIPGDSTIDCSGRWIFPGAIDPHVHFYDPGNTAKEDFAKGTAFAASGGVTTIIDMPCTSNPPVSNAENLQKKLNIISPKAVIDYGFFGGVSRQMVDEEPESGTHKGYKAAMESINNDVLGFKVYTISGMENMWGSLDYRRLEMVMQHAGRLNTVLLIHAEERGYIEQAESQMRARGNGPEEWYESRPEIAEILAVQSAITLAEQTGVRLHIVHIGTGKAAEAVHRARKEGQDISGETCPQYLAFDCNDFFEKGPVLKIAPPLKSPENKQQIWKNLENGSLSFIASDHAPGAPGEKEPGNIWGNAMGICGTGTLFPYLLSEGYIKGKVTLDRFLEAVSMAAAERFGISDRKGSIEPGKDADLIIVDPDTAWTVDGGGFLSKSTLTPFQDYTFRGRVLETYVRGRRVYNYRQGITVDGGWGRFLRKAGV